MKKNHLTKSVFALIAALFLFTTSGFAEEKATKEECMTKVKQAAEIAKKDGLEAAIATVNDPNGTFVWKDTYVFALDVETGMVTAHPIKPKLIGKMLTGLKDVNGKMFFVEFINVGKEKGEGWVDYMWPKPGEKKPSPKESYVYMVPGTNTLFIAGVYK